MKEFRTFVLRGNVVDLAVGVVIGAAFGAIVSSLVADILTPLLGLLNIPDFSTATVEVGAAEIRYGSFINALVAFLMIALAVFFGVVKPLNRLVAKIEGPQDELPAMKDCPQCLSSIKAAATRCPNCTSELVSS